MKIVHWIAPGVLCLSLLLPWSIARSTAVGAQIPPAGGHSRLPSWQLVVSGRAAPRLSKPTALAIDQRGQSIQKWMYLIDAGNDRVVKLGTGGHYLGTWGTQGTAAGEFQQPAGIAIDPHGDVYVTDAGNNRIEKFGANGRFLSQWGTKGTGPGQFNDPSGVAVGGSGNVFVADRDNHRIEKFSPSGQLRAVWPVFIPTNSNPTGFGPAGPYALAVDARGFVYAAVDSGQCSGGHCVMDYIVLETFSPAGRVVRSIVGGNPYGPYSYQPVSGVTGVGPWWQIGALAVASRGRLFLAEWNPQNQASVTEFSATGTTIGQWELPKPSGAAGWPPQGMALDPRGNVFVSDTQAHRVLKLVFDGR